VPVLSPETRGTRADGIGWRRLLAGERGSRPDETVWRSKTVMPWWAWFLIAVVLVVIVGLPLAALALLRFTRRDGERSALGKRVMALPWRAKAALLWRLLKDHRVPWWAKALLPALLLYLALPVDLIPDFIPVLGHLDDLLVVLLVVAVLLRAVPPETTEEHLSSLESREG